MPRLRLAARFIRPRSDSPARISSAYCGPPLCGGDSAELPHSSLFVAGRGHLGFLSRRIFPYEHLVIPAGEKSKIGQGSSRRYLHASVVLSKEIERIDLSVSVNPLEQSKLEVEPVQVISDNKKCLGDHAEVGGEDSLDRHKLTAAHGAKIDNELYTSSTSTDECDLSELELESGETPWPSLDFEHAMADVDGKEDASRIGGSEIEEFSDRVVSDEDLLEGALDVNAPGNHHGRSYLHQLSADEVREILDKARAKDVRIYEVRERCEWVDQLVFASGRSSRHLRGMADALLYKVKKCSANVGPNSFPTVEGRDGEQWMLVDCGNMVVHLFLEEARRYYNLEEMWKGKAHPRLVEDF